MKKSLHSFLLCLCFPIFMQAQDEEFSKTRFVAGLAFTEFFHLGANFDISKYNQLGASGGLLMFYGYHPTLNIEHRLYLNDLYNTSKSSKWFLRQGGSYFFIVGDEVGWDYQFAAVASVGVDLLSKSKRKGWTIDIGGFLAFPKKGAGPPNENIRILPSFRVQYFFYFKKKKME